MEVNLCTEEGSQTQRVHKDLYYKGTRKAWGKVVTPQKHVPASKNIGTIKEKTGKKFFGKMDDTVKDLSDTF